MQNISRSNFGSLLYPGLMKIFGDTYNDQTLTHRQIFTVKKSTQAYERIQQITGLGLASIKNEGASVAYDRMLEGFQKEYTHVTYALGASVSFEAYEDDQYDKINKLPRHIARSIAHTQETVAYNVLNNAFTTETTADGVPLVSDAHPLIGGGVASNKLATSGDLSEATLQALMTQIMLATDDRGLRIKLKPKKLVVHPDTKWTATELMRSDLSTATATNSTTGITNTNSINTLKGAVDVLVSEFLVDPDAFYITTDIEDGLTVMERSPVRFDRDQEFSTLNLNFMGYTRFSVGVTDWRGVYSSDGSGS